MPETQRRPTLRSYTSGNGLFWAGVAVGVGVLIVASIMGSYAASLRDDIAAIDGKLDTLEKSRNKEHETALVAASKQSKVLRSLVSGKAYWSQALAAMERMTQSSVSFKNMQATAKEGIIKFSGTGLGYATVAKQLRAFVDGTGVKDAVMSNVKALPDGTIEFSGQLTIDTAALLRRAQASPTPTP